ncbi:adenosine deaminase [Ruegeria sp. EL01]|uniref:adenosine deaminase n=1 Tax=Ruegeria sp. EL01 TaxID=2107578 RepID=UPI0013C437A4|nr:adenosine deaminase [Ruegeria sp. EL01]
MTERIPMAEIHVHLECTVTPERAGLLAKKNGITLPDSAFGPSGDFHYVDFADFLRLTEIVSECIRTEQDYYDITADYLTSAADCGVIYQELIYWPELAARNGLTSEAALAGIKQAVRDVEEKSGLTTLLQAVMVRHDGPEAAESVATWAANLDEPLLRGVNLAGNEVTHGPELFTRAFAIARQAGLECIIHAGEAVGPESIRAALNVTGVSRIGHGVRAVEDPALVEELVERGVTLEVCPSSNIWTGVFDDLKNHTLRQLFDAGVKVTLNSDDPPYFFSTIDEEYDIARETFGFSDAELLDLTHNAILAGMLSNDERMPLLNEVDDYRQKLSIG